MKKKPPKRTRGEFWYDEDAALRVVEFCHEFIHHTKGEWAGQPFILQPWQDQYLRTLFGWKRADGTRQYRMTLWMLPRKQGKSFLASAIALYLLFSDGEPGAEIYSAAADREQAAIVFDMAREIVSASPALASRAEIFRRSIVVPATHSSYKVLSADALAKYGFSVHGLIFDELMAQQNRLLWDALTTASGARRQPLIFAISTAGFDRHSLCRELYDYATKVQQGVVIDDSFLPVLFGAADEDDWTDPRVWKSVNPNLGVSVKPEFLEQECRRAQETPAFENTFRRLYLNQWTQQDVRWMPMEKWDVCNHHPVTLEEMKGRICYAGLDLASTTDLAALVLLFPPLDEEDFWQVIPYYWVPEDNVALRAKRDQVDYATWIKTGHIIPTEGNVIDQDAIRMAITGPKLSAEDMSARVEERRQILREWKLPPDGLANIVQIKEVAIDRWNSTQLQTQLLGDGQLVVQFGQGFASMSAPTKELMGLVLGKKLNHGGHPVLRWNASNAAVRQDPAGNQKLDKEKSTEKIDGLVSLVMALGRASLQQVEGRSVYEDRGLVSV